MWKTIAVCISTLVIPQIAVASEAQPQSVDEIKECIERSGPKRSSVQEATLRTVDESGGTKESEARLYWRKFDDGLSRALIRFDAPPDLRGSALLLIEKEGEDTDVYMYLPEFRKVRRVTTGMMSGSMFGTDFTYEEFERLYGLAEDLSSKRLADASIGDSAVYVVESKPENEADSEYDRIVQYVEQKRCIPLKSEFFSGGDDPHKVMSVDEPSMRQINGAWVPSQVTMQDLKQGSHTTLVVKKVEVDVDVPERTFSQRSLSKGH